MLIKMVTIEYDSHITSIYDKLLWGFVGDMFDKDKVEKSHHNKDKIC